MTPKQSVGSMTTFRIPMVSHIAGIILGGFYLLTLLFLATIFKLQGDVVGMHGRLTVREHCQLAVAYRRILLSHKAELQASARDRESVCPRASIVNEMHRVCAEFVETVNRRLLPVSRTGEETVYCWTMYVSSCCSSVIFFFTLNTFFQDRRLPSFDVDLLDRLPRIFWPRQDPLKCE